MQNILLPDIGRASQPRTTYPGKEKKQGEAQPFASTLKTKTARVSIIGMGYVGLCTAATFASKGIHSIGIDIDQERIDQIHKGKTPIHEPDLDRLLTTAVRKKLLDASTDISSITETDITFLTVGTPSQPDGSIDLSYIKKAS